MNITIFGHGHLGSAVGKNFELSGNQVQYVTHENNASLGDLIVLAVPYPAIQDIIDRYQNQLSGKIVVDAVNPVDFRSWNKLVPADTSSAQQLAESLPDSHVLKAFNTATAATLSDGQLSSGAAPQVLVAGDNDSAKQNLASALKDSPLQVINTGDLTRARELESLGLLELSMAAHKQLPINGGFLVIK